MKLIFDTIKVKDMEASLGFYRDTLGLKVARQFQAGPNRIVFLETGGAELELIAAPGHEQLSAGTNLSLGFEVDSLDEVLKVLEQAGIPLYAGPMSPSPQIRFALVRDPDGVILQLSEHLNA